MFFGCSHFEKIFFGSCCQSGTPKTQNVFYTPCSAWIHENIYREGTHVSAHMYICPDFHLIFYHDPCCYLVYSLVLFLCYPRRRYNSLFIAAYLCPDNKLFYAWFIFVDNADVMGFCKSFEPGCSAPNLCHASFL